MSRSKKRTRLDSTNSRTFSKIRLNTFISFFVDDQDIREMLILIQEVIHNGLNDTIVSLHCSEQQTSFIHRI